MDENRFDVGGRHLLLQRGGSGWQKAVERGRKDPLVAREVSSLEGQGPFGYSQDWQVYSYETSPEMFHIDGEHGVL
jgi:hypothetical protein